MGIPVGSMAEQGKDRYWMRTPSGLTSVSWDQTLTLCELCGSCERFVSTHGLPRILVSDNGPQFASSEFVEFMQNNGILRKRTLPCHPALNGLIERFVQELKLCLKEVSEGTYRHKDSSN